MIFKKENIDVARIFIDGKSRGANFIVGAVAKYVTPDKRLESVSSISRFETTANQFIKDFQVLDERYKLLMEQYNKIQEPQAKEKKALFSKQTNRVQIENQVRASRPIVKHLKNSIQVLKGIEKGSFGFRVFYQAGEIEIDLATPNGKSYSSPKPSAKQPAGKKEPAKKGPVKKAPPKKAPAKKAPAKKAPPKK